MAVVVLGGASASEPADPLAEERQPAPAPLDLFFVAEGIRDPGWSSWGESFSGLEDLVTKIAAELEPGRRVRRLVLAAYSADHTSGFVSFDTGFGGRERIDGLNMNPIRPEVQAKLAKLAPLLGADGVVELRVCGMGEGEHGQRALQAVADCVGVPARGPVQKSAAMRPLGGLVHEWLTVYPSATQRAPVRSGWLESWTDGIRTIDPAYAPIPNGAPRPLPAPQAAPGELHFATENAAAWCPGLPRIAGVGDLADRVLASDQPIQRLSVTSQAATAYEGFFAFDPGEGESIDGSIREQPGYPHLQVIFARVREELERLRPKLAPGAVVEFRAARFGAGESGRRALQAVADLLGVEVRAPACSSGELKAAAGLITHWRAVFPSESGRAAVESTWREMSEPHPAPGWVPLEAAAFAPIQGLAPALPERVHAAPTPEPIDPALAPTIPPKPAAATATTTLLVVCAGCGRILGEPPATPMRARMPCPGCGSLARRRETGPLKATRQGPLDRLRGLVKRQRAGLTPGPLL